MGWTIYRNWSGAVTGRTIRVPQAMRLGIAAYGPSANPLTLRAGAVGTIVNVLPAGAGAPSYVKFKGPIPWGLAAEVTIARARNADVVWRDLATVAMTGAEARVVIPRNVLDNLEIET